MQYCRTLSLIHILIFTGSSEKVRCFCNNCLEPLCSADFCLVGFKSDERLDQLCANDTVTFDCSLNFDGWMEVCTCKEDFCNTFAYLRRQIENKGLTPEFQEAKNTTATSEIVPSTTGSQAHCFCDRKNCGHELTCFSIRCFVTVNASGLIEQRCSYENESELSGCICIKDHNGFETTCFCQGDFCNTFNFLRAQERKPKKPHNITLLPPFPIQPDILTSTEIMPTMDCFCDRALCDGALMCKGKRCLVGMRSPVRLEHRCVTNEDSSLNGCTENWNGFEQVCTCEGHFCNSYAYLRIHIERYRARKGVKMPTVRFDP